jgi:predicted metal-binding membrane protein
MNVSQNTRSRARGATAAALTTTLALAAVCWIVSIRQMTGMDMGTATRLGSFAFFLALWVPMMGAMMLPGAAPAALRRARATGRVRAVLVFVGSYLAIWALVGVVMYAMYRPHGSVAAGMLVIAAGIYELTPLKRHFRRECWHSSGSGSGSGSGFGFGLCCVGSSINLMVMLVALGVMSITWMAVIAALAVYQKLRPAQPVIDVPLALAIVGLGIFILISAPTI